MRNERPERHNRNDRPAEKHHRNERNHRKEKRDKMDIERSIGRSIERSIDINTERVRDSDRRHSEGISQSFTRSIGSSVELVFSPSRGNTAAYADEEELRWAALEKLPTYDRLRTSILKTVGDEKGWYENREVDVRTLGLNDRQEFIDRIIKVAEEDNERLLKKLRDRFDRVGIKLPTVEVRFKHVNVEAECYIGNRALPTLPNQLRNMVESVQGLIGIRLANTSTLTILKDASGIIRPSRMTLLLGPPASGKTTFLRALAGRIDPSLKNRGLVTYNGYRLSEFVPQKTAAYISQHDVHIGEMTVKETLDYSARCQGVGDRYDLLKKLAKKEKEAGIHPEAEVDLFMKATAMKGVESSLQTDYTLKILGLDVCANTIVGDEMLPGISGGQKKRVTTGEMIVGPTKTLFMDEISTGLDTSTTFQIVKCLQQIVHLGEATILMSLLQPSPETFELFDDVILLSEGQIVYQGPCEHVLEFFESCGFKCPERKGAADFLQEVTSRNDQEQYWSSQTKPYRHISISEFAAQFKRFHVGERLREEISTPFNKKKGHKAAIVFSKYSVSKFELLKASFAKEWLLIKRNSFLYIFKTVQIIVVAFIGATVFFRTKMHTKDEHDGFTYIGALLFSLNVNMFNGFAESAMIIARLPVLYKHRDMYFYPPWIFTLPNFLLRIPISMLESVVWVLVTYFAIGFAPEGKRFFEQLLIVFLVQQMAAGLFRLNAGVCRSMTVTNTVGSLCVLVTFVLGGFVIPKSEIPKWWIWGYWVSPLTYAYNSLAVNELFSSRWMDQIAPDGRKLGVAVLEDLNIFVDRNWYWIGAGALMGFSILFNVLFTYALMYLNPLGKQQAVISEEVAMEMEANQDESDEFPRFRRGILSGHSTPLALASTDGNKNSETALHYMNSRSVTSPPGGRAWETYNNAANMGMNKNGMVLPFTPLAMSFKNVNYFVDMPAQMKVEGVNDTRLQLLREVTGAFRPGVLTALMGVSGAGKTTLMDVLAGRKTGGYIEGDIRISGYPKVQETFARVSGYCEQNDIHSPQVTVMESLIFSAFLRLPQEVDDREKMEFVEEVMELVELDTIKDSLVGTPGITGLSTEQRKRLTIAVELVANPSIIFMDEPTSGLDARAAAIVMRTVRNTVDTGRTVVCTIHQPSIDIFESFDELLLLKRGGQVIYSGSVGQSSHKLVEYFEAIPGVPKIKEKYNPATWMLEVSSAATEARLGNDFAEHYKSSTICKRNKALVRELSKPLPGTSDIYFPTQYCLPPFEQFKHCLWKQWWTYWRSPGYNLARLLFTFITALLLGSIFWMIGRKRESATNLASIIGAMYSAVLFAGVINCITVQTVTGIERTVFYREKVAGMYSAIPYALSQVIVEIPYVFFQTLYYTLIVYSMMGFEWTVVKFFWFFYISFFTFLYFTYYGMMSVAMTPNLQVAGIFSATFYSLFNLFSGFFIPKPRIPKWWIWYFWICPVSWTVYGLIVTQYGDLENIIKVPGEPDQMIKTYVKEYYGYDLDFMGVVAAVLAGWAIFFAVMFVYCIQKLNFQYR